MTAGYVEGSPVFSGLSLSFGRTGLVHVRGGNGTGKSTLVELCSGYLVPWQGTVRVGGLDANSPAARAGRRICRTQPALYPDMTVRDHIVFTSRCRGAAPDGGLDRAVRLGLGPWLDHAAKTLSTGNTRKLWYVICTLGSFGCAVLDEPFNGIDQEGVEKIAGELSLWGADRLVLLISHTLPAALTVTDECVLDRDLRSGESWH
ncbi:ATP-binding cassette domain-containing protein [Streptomyces sp. FIT100]|uniref:ABC transporter ATP-binding protein n=1 Tax=Streptomyces sp. FIT100 TaxID=2837956 RepID=UPI0021C801E5|nr:ATP-binding cassette domain-containing protein [Streptomyces sp. FIT100]UUN27771.1 ATP-binding cassette domain-containing protein [Streptomyces sp. FIT100]